MVGILQERNIKVSIVEDDFQFVRTNFLSEIPANQNITSWFAIGYIFSSLENTHQKDEISTFVKHSFEKAFDAGRYYLAMMFEMMPPDVYLNGKYANEIEAIINDGPKTRAFANKEYYIDNRIDNYFNFCLKYSIEIPQNILEKTPTMGSYYRWLCDLDNYDYTHFNKDWLYNHFTLFFKRKFRKSNVLKEYLLNLMQSDANTDLERIFMLIYNYDI